MEESQQQQNQQNQQTEQQPDQLQLKQNLLQTEILEKNYDQMEFLNFCTSQKENGDDLNNWNLDELKACVENFQESVKKKQSESKNSSLNFFLSSAKHNTNINSNPQISNNMNNINNINNSMPIQNPAQNVYINQPYNNNYPPYQQNMPQNYQQQYSPYQQYNPQIQSQFPLPNTSIPGTNPQNQPQMPVAIQTLTLLNPLQQMLNSEKMQQKINTDIQNVNLELTNQSPPKKEFEIICKRSEKTVLNDKEIKVVIQNPKNSEKSLLTSQYTIYEVCTESMHWLVHRRYSDFDWLRNILSKFFPRILIPPLPGKKMGNRRFEQDFIEKRMKFLQIFMDKVIQNETLKSSEALYAFLSFGDRVQFDRKIKELNSIVPSQYCEDLKTLSGKLTVLYDDFNENYYVNINNYFKLQYQVYTRLNYNMRSFYKNITMACMNLEEVQKDFETLKILNTKVMMSKWEIEDNYGQVDRALLFRDKNYAFNNMCTKETQALENIHKMLGYANYMNNDQLKSIIKYNEKKFVEITKEFANKFYPSLNDGITLWSTLNTYV